MLPENDRRPRLLIVEDDPEIAAMYRLGLGMSGFDVALACNGRIGLEAIRAQVPDLVLLDIGMPEMDGFELLWRLQADPKLRQTKVVVLTNFSEPVTREQCLAAGALDFVLKVTVTPRELAQHVVRWIAEPG